MLLATELAIVTLRNRSAALREGANGSDSPQPRSPRATFAYSPVCGAARAALSKSQPNFAASSTSATSRQCA